MPISPRLSEKTLRRMRRTALKQLTKKQTVMARHEIGTAYHTRAQREAEVYQDRIEQIDEILTK